MSVAVYRDAEGYQQGTIALANEARIHSQPEFKETKQQYRRLCCGTGWGVGLSVAGGAAAATVFLDKSIGLWILIPTVIAVAGTSLAFYSVIKIPKEGPVFQDEYGFTYQPYGKKKMSQLAPVMATVICCSLLSLGAVSYAIWRVTQK